MQQQQQQQLQPSARRDRPQGRHRLAVAIAASMLGASVLTGLVVASVLSPAWAETGTTNKATQTLGDDTSNFVVPYDGYLMLDSTALNGSLDLQFRLYETASGGAAEWSETQTVTFYNGRFSVGLGAVTRINEDLLDADQLYLEIALDDGSGNLVTLSGRQAIEPVPYAIWSAHAANLNVAGDANIEGTLRTDAIDDAGSGTVAVSAALTATSATLTGALSAGSVSASGAISGATLSSTGTTTVGAALTVNGSTVLGDNTIDSVATSGFLTTGRGLQVGSTGGGGAWLYVTGTDLYFGTDNDSGRGNGGRALVQQTSDTLYVNYNGDFTGGTVVNSDLTVTGDITNFAVNTSYGTASVSNTNTTNTVTLANLTNSVCFLSYVSMEDIDGEGEVGICRVEASGTNWVLRAEIQRNLTVTIDSDVNCKATCLTW